MKQLNSIFHCDKSFLNWWELGSLCIKLLWLLFVDFFCSTRFYDLFFLLCFESVLIFLFQSCLPSFSELLFIGDLTFFGCNIGLNNSLSVGLWAIFSKLMFWVRENLWCQNLFQLVGNKNLFSDIKFISTVHLFYLSECFSWLY